ncbi:gp53-like domain-containing protein [Pseudomonas sichuanensis]|uniref:gp53-like domain-containing protein n=1 Tax=Pseudomonas sichuanensis TaxID=2213015 RepID=UPI003CC511FA
MRWGFAVSLAANGYIIFPTWMGGLIVQWATTSHTGENIALSLPVAFPSACVFACVNMQTDNGAAVVMVRTKTNLSGSALISATNATGTNTYNWLAIGY